MKKIVSILIALALTLSLVACGGGGESQNSPNGKENTAGVQVDEGLLNVEVTLAASFFEDQT